MPPLGGRAEIGVEETAFVDAYKIPAETVQVWIHEGPADSWGAAGKLTADKWEPPWIGGAAGCSW
ncbi:tautomerase family protein [Streptomyces sp900105755]|uniref:tautomerase family protein n=1 Tax=Streptomyces sp. 900105755 TaxID=3154389 RepID=UPI0033327AF7